MDVHVKDNLEKNKNQLEIMCNYLIKAFHT
jgi:hypothetical protein